MQAIILAAGRGKRLCPLTDEKPKSLVKLNGCSILEHELERISEQGEVDEVILVVGYKKEMIMQKIGTEFGGLKITYAENDEWDSTDNLYSMNIALEFVEPKERLICLNGDLVFERGVLEQLVEHKEDVCLVVDRKDCTAEDVKVKVQSHKIYQIEKNIWGNDIYGEFIGLSMYSAEGVKQLKNMISELSENMLKNSHVAAGIQKIIDKNIPVYKCDVAGRFWEEIDFNEELYLVRDKLYKDRMNPVEYTEPEA